MPSKELIILDRDGCINAKSQDSRYVFKDEDFSIFDDVIPFINAALSVGYSFAVATNQQGISKKLYTIEDVLRLHQILLDKIHAPNLDIPIYVCSHLSSSKCECRKPRPMLLEQAMSHFGVSKSKTLFIGDSESDLEAAKFAGIDFLYLNRNATEKIEAPRTIHSLSLELVEGC